VITWNEHKTLLKGALDDFSFDERIIRALKFSREEKRNVFIAGNGGSAALALHFVADINKCANKDWANNENRFRAISLVGDSGYLTALGNDVGYENVFLEQLRNLAKPGDVLIVISSSGNSPNVVKAAEWANRKGLVTIGFTGFKKDNKLNQICKYKAFVPREQYGLVEDVHSVFIHWLTWYALLEED
jgi:D-sedoheptulose 7-phosphate isomerase